MPGATATPASSISRRENSIEPAASNCGGILAQANIEAGGLGMSQPAPFIDLIRVSRRLL
ncbi:hypothetical protein D3C87_2171130 [compost metagenome]